MQNQTCFVLLAAALIGFAAANPLDENEGPVLHRARRNRPCTFGCSTTVVGDGLNVQNNPNGDRHRVITNQGSWGSSSGYQPAGSQEGRTNQGGNHGGNHGGNQGGNRRPTAGGNHGAPNDVQISRPCHGCALDVQGTGNVIRS